MRLYSYLGPESFIKEYKEAVLSNFPPLAESFDQLINHQILSLDYEINIKNQINHDLNKYVPRYISCFYNSKRPTLKWYYGVDDEGLVTGIPLLNLNFENISKKIIDHVQNLVNNNLRVVIPNLDNHKCNEQHYKMEYRNLDKWISGYYCPGHTRNLNKFIDINIIKLDSPKPKHYLMSHPEMADILRIKQMIDDERILQRQHIDDMKVWRSEYKKWIDLMNDYSTKISIILSDPKRMNEFVTFMRNYDLKSEDYCHNNVDMQPNCYQVGKKYIKDPPFLDIFRKFRDIQRDKIRQLRPIRPKKHQNRINVFASRLGYLSYDLSLNPNVKFYIIEIQLNQQPIFDNDAIVVYLHNNYWQSKIRIDKPDGSPQCI